MRTNIQLHNKAVQHLANGKAPKSKKKRAHRRPTFSITGFIPVFPTLTELNDELLHWSELDPLRIGDVSIA